MASLIKESIPFTDQIIDLNESEKPIFSFWVHPLIDNQAQASQAGWQMVLLDRIHGGNEGNFQ